MLGGLTALSACGFRPLYGEDSPEQALRGRLAVGKITHGTLPDRLGFRLAEALRSGIGEGGTPQYRIDADVTVTEFGLAITPDNATTRYNLTGTANWSLTPLAGSQPVMKGVAESHTAYSATASVYATRIARRDAESRLGRALAERILIQIAARAGEIAG